MSDLGMIVVRPSPRSGRHERCSCGYLLHGPLLFAGRLGWRHCLFSDALRASDLPTTLWHLQQSDRGDARFYNRLVNASERHLQPLTESIAAVNSTLDLEEVLSLVARKVAEALDAEACFVYLYDEAAGEPVLRATQGTSTRR